MPAYELSLIIRGTLTRPQLAEALKRSCSHMLNRGSVISQIENLGNRDLPYRIRTHGTNHLVGNYFLIHFDTSVQGLNAFTKDFLRDEDIVKNCVARKAEEFRRPCLDGPCVFGEIPDPLHEKRIFRKKTLKQLNEITFSARAKRK